MNISFLKFSNKLILIFFLIIFSPFFEFLSLKANNIDNNQIHNNNKILSKINKNMYLLSAGDSLTINFIGLENFSGNYLILPDGTINLPLIGTVEANLISIESLTNKLIDLYKAELIVPDLFITINKRRDIRVSVIGEVNKPGLFNLTRSNSESNNASSLNLNNFPTVVDAISKAGGITPRSDISSVKIARLIEGQNINYKKTKLNLINLLMKGDQSQNLILFDGDIITIPEIQDNKIISNRTLKIAKANLSPEKITINVIGAVDKPGEYKVKPNTPLIKGILLANGLSPWEASKTNVKLLRINSNGSVSVKKYKFNIKEKVSYEKNPPLLDGDVIQVNTTSFSKFKGGVRSVTQPFSDILSSYSLFKLVLD